jgi:hypothetical protein
MMEPAHPYRYPKPWYSPGSARPRTPCESAMAEGRRADLLCHRGRKQLIVVGFFAENLTHTSSTKIDSPDFKALD